MTIHTQHRHGHHAVHTHPVHHPAPAVTPKYIRGIDVSHHNEGGSKNHHVHIDWKAVKESGVTFAFTKATQGTTVTDNSFRFNWPAMKAAGLIRGAFHYGLAGHDAKKQAQHFFKVVQPQAGDLRLVLDLEWKGNLDKSASALRNWAKKFLDEIEHLTGQPAIFYSGGPFVTDNMGNPPGNWNCPLWISEVVPESRVQHYMPKAWDDWTFWQWAEMKATPGTPHGAEQDYFKGTLADLQKLTYTTTPSGS
jgi:lysozyme